jgi:hypothetical protein
MRERYKGAQEFKHISAANWKNIDEQTALWAQATTIASTPEGWVEFYRRPVLKSRVPPEIVTLLEVARGAMIYGWFFYPLVTIGAEQCLRVLESGVRLRCQQASIQTKVTRKGGREVDTSFDENVTALLGSNLLAKMDKLRWDAVRCLRNSTSHPRRQMILDPGQGQSVLELSVEVLNDLFQ